MPLLTFTHKLLGESGSVLFRLAKSTQLSAPYPRMRRPQENDPTLLIILKSHREKTFLGYLQIYAYLELFSSSFAT